LKIEATASEIQDLLALAEVDARAAELTPAAHDSRWQAASKRVTPALLRRYRQLVEAGRHPAAVPIERAACSGCNIRLPTMVESLTKRVLAVYECPHCHRMLYAPDRLAAAVGKADAERPHKTKRPARAPSHA
jgi:predicted  nucleic acid-binding Zn-ribbon protein